MKKKLVLMTSALMAISLLAGCNAHSHEYKFVDEVAATCTESGVHAHYTCEGCDKLFDEDKKETTLEALTIAALGHDYKFDSFVWADDYSAQAKYVCSHDASHIKLNDATVTSQVTTEPGCETEGVRTYSATYDGHTDTKTAVIPAKEHNWGIPSYTWSEDNLTCTATRVCSNDSNHIDTETVNAVVSNLTATCTENGTATYTATFENTAFVAQVKDNVAVAALGHDWGDPTYTWSEDNSTCTATRVCKGDEGHKETETANSTYVVLSEAKCEVDGKGKYSVSFENEAFSAQSKEVKIDALEHDYQFAEFVWGDDYSAKAKYVCSHDASHIKLNDATVTSQVTTEPGCETEGVRTYSATYDGHTDTKTAVIPAKEHNWGTPTYEWNTDYSQCTASRVCANDETHIDTETTASTREVLALVTFDNENTIYRHTADFENPAFEVQIVDIAVPYLGEYPVFKDDRTQVKYGLYPQTNVSDSSLVSALNALTTPESNGWYLYDGDYYAKVSATPNSSSYKFDNGTTIVSGTTYWFKCEPITWNVLNNNNDEYYIVSSVLLDTHCYYNSTSTRTIDGQTVYANNYKYSDIRTWLNADFYNSAFALGNDYIQTTTVDNSAATTNSTSNSYACANTEDKVFLPSYQDYINSSYGFSTSTGSTNTRYCKTTDWARARGAWYSTSSSYLYNGYYWTRSPDSGYPYGAWLVRDDGRLYFDDVDGTNRSVRPSLSIKIA